jgi:hypothetical protein
MNSKTAKPKNRPGQGRIAANKVAGELKHPVTVKVYPTHRDELIMMYGSVQAALDSLTEPTIKPVKQ